MKNDQFKVLVSTLNVLTFALFTIVPNIRLLLTHSTNGNEFADILHRVTYLVDSIIYTFTIFQLQEEQK